jgi:DNA-binding PadR family transcriptional regulator
MFLVLSEVSVEEGRHAYAIHKALNREHLPAWLRRSFLAPAIGSTYGAIEELLHRRLIYTRSRLIRGNARNVYFMTAEGRRVLSQLWAYLEEHKPGRLFKGRHGATEAGG